MDEHLYDFGPKVLVATFRSTDFVGKYYENSILEIYDGDELIDTLYWIEEYRAEYVFEYHYGDGAEDPTTHEQTTLRIDEDLELEADKGIASLIYACWHNGAPTAMSCENNSEDRAYITFCDPLCADNFLTGIFANGAISWDGNKVDPADWEWKTYPFDSKDGSTKNTVSVYFPPELIELLTKNLTSEKSDFPEPGKMISALLPEVEEEVQRRIAEIEKHKEEDG